jgi:hypothetical protein
MATQTAWYLRPIIIMGHQYAGDIPPGRDSKTLEKLVRFKRSLGFDAEHLLLNHSMLQGAEGGDDSRAYLFKNRHGYEHDLLADYLPLAHKHGLRVIVYFNCHWFRSTAFGADFLIRDAAGSSPALYGSGPGVCPRGPFRQWSAEMAEDLGRYPIDGVFLDGPMQERCFCATCRAEWQKAHNLPMPTSEAECPDELRETWLNFPGDSAIAYVQAFADGLARTNPNAILYINDIGEGADGRVMAATADFTHLIGAEGGFVGYRPLDGRFPFHPGLTAKILESRAAAGSRPRGRVVFCDCGYKSFDYYTHPRGEIVRMYAGTIANGANPWFLVLRDGQRTDGIAAARKFNRLIDVHRDSLANGQSLATAAILHSPLNFRLGKQASAAGDDVGKRDQSAGRMVLSRHRTEFEGAYSALARSGVPVDVIEEANLTAGLPPRTKLIVLPAVGAMSDATAEKLRQFVAGGGTLLGTFDTSLFDEQGRRRAELALADVFGVRVRGELMGPSKLDYLAVTRANLLTRGLSQPTLPCPEYWHYVELAGAKPLLMYREKMPRRYALLPEVSDQPAATINRFGRGRAIMIPSAIGDHYRTWGFHDHRRLLANAVRMLAAPPVRIDGGDEFVEATLRQGADGSVVLHLVNYAGGERPASGAVPIGPLKIAVRLPGGMQKVKSVRACYEPANLKFAAAGRQVTFTLPRLGDYEMIEIAGD